MNSIIALTEDARRRAEKTEKYCDPTENKGKIADFTEIDRLLLFAVFLILIYSDANIILLLAILYVAL